MSIKSDLTTKDVIDRFVGSTPFKKKVFAVIGHPIAHSLSPELHRIFAEQCVISLCYEKYCVATHGAVFENFVRDFFAQGGAGLNITTPFKERALHCANTLTERARLAQAVNTLLPLSKTEILGDNTDGFGLVEDLIKNQRQPITGQKILILGSGGATQGILPALQAQQPHKITVASRTHFTAYADLIAPFDLIINATPLSLYDQLPPLSSAIIHDGSFCYDLVYDKSRETIFTRWAKQHGVASCDGLGMLVAQAAEAFYHWHHVRPTDLHVAGLKILL